MPTVSDSIELQVGRISFCPQLGVSHILELHNAVWRVLDDDVVEFDGSDSAVPTARTVIWKSCLRSEGGCPTLTGWDYDVLLPQVR